MPNLVGDVNNPFTLNLPTPIERLPNPPSANLGGTLAGMHANPGMPPTTPAANIPGVGTGGNILGMTPQIFASIAGQLAGALEGPDSWQGRLGGVAANMGSQKIQQLATAVKEKKQEELMKAMLDKIGAADLHKVATTGMFHEGLGNFTPAQTTQETLYGQSK